MRRRSNRPTARTGAARVDVLDLTAAAPARTVRYGADPAQDYEVRDPADTPRGTTVVVVHGGFWRSTIDRRHAQAQAQALCDNGFHVAVPEYRRTGMPGGGWPGTAEDIATAVTAIRRDPDLPGHTVLVGHSAGGQLVAWAACQEWAQGLAGVVALAGCVDLRLCARRRLGDGAVQAFMGGEPEDVPSQYAAADPSRQAARVPVHLVHGESDATVPPEISLSYQRVRRERGESEATLTTLEHTGHLELIDPREPAFEVVTAVITRAASGAPPAAG